VSEFQVLVQPFLRPSYDTCLNRQRFLAAHLNGPASATVRDGVLLRLPVDRSSSCDYFALFTRGGEDVCDDEEILLVPITPPLQSWIPRLWHHDSEVTTSLLTPSPLRDIPTTSLAMSLILAKLLCAVRAMRQDSAKEPTPCCSRHATHASDFEPRSNTDQQC